MDTDNDPSLAAAVTALYAFLLHTPAALIGLWLPDGLGDRRQPNMPGTIKEYPNWCLPMADARGRPVSLDELRGSARLPELVRALRELAPPQRPADS